MVWGRMVALAGMLCAGAGLAVPALADTLVVRASGPSAKSYQPGSKLADGGALVLKAGDVLTLLDARGTRTLRGPGRFSVTAAATTAPASGVALSAVLDTKRVRRVRTGAVRGNASAALPPRRPNLWLVDVAQPGLVCVADPASVRLWRADAGRPVSVRIAGEGTSATAAFPAGEAMALWPAALPLREGAAYRLSEGAHSTDIRFAMLDKSASGLDGMAAGLLAHKCTAQLDLLVDTAGAQN
ncbi:hypothetical protein [Sphingobium bisphenolivorans]|uniref:hypothetical protein n=1 Tax=Sphingobium bisphenolivorans TaxID=1335760 RepID=UPI0003A3AB0E|nr:hypothetical protein [Sphingobium bisphenolivorans]